MSILTHTHPVTHIYQLTSLICVLRLQFCPQTNPDQEMAGYMLLQPKSGNMKGADLAGSVCYTSNIQVNAGLLLFMFYLKCNSHTCTCILLI